MNKTAFLVFLGYQINTIMKKVILPLMAVAILGFTSCGPNEKDKAAAEKAIADSTAAAQATADSIAAAEAAMPKDIVTTAINAGNFQTLATALQAAGLVETLQGAGPFTVFAPTDEAFAKLPAGTVEDLLKPENKEKLISILTYHVVSGKVMAADVAGMTEAATVNGKKAKVTASDAGVMVDKSNVTGTDIEASNGVIHVIDQVLMP